MGLLRKITSRGVLTNAVLASYVLLVVIVALFGVSNGDTPQESATGNE